MKTLIAYVSWYIIKNESDGLNLLPELAYYRGFSITFLNAWKFEDLKTPLIVKDSI